MKFFISIATAVLMLASNAYGVNEYYSISRSIRALGMGGAFYGLSDDENALFYNPAGLAFYEKTGSFMLSFKADASTSLIPAISTMTTLSGKNNTQIVNAMAPYQGTPFYVGATPFFAYFLKKNFSMGLLVGDTKTNFSLSGSGVDTSVDATVISDSGLFIGFSIPLPLPGLAVGANIKGLARAGGTSSYGLIDLADGNPINFNNILGAGVGVDFDLGATYQVPEILPGVKLRGSLVINNVLASPLSMVAIRNYGPPPGLSRMVTLAGLAQFPGFWIFHHINALLDLAEFGLGGQSNPDLGARVGSVWKHVNFGAELPIGSWFAFRAGFRQGNLSAGFGFDARFFQLDFATYAEELATIPGALTSRRIAVRLAFGWGGGTPKVESATQTHTPPPSEKPVQTVPTPASHNTDSLDVDKSGN